MKNVVKEAVLPGVPAESALLLPGRWWSGVTRVKVQTVSFIANSLISSSQLSRPLPVWVTEQCSTTRVAPGIVT